MEEHTERTTPSKKRILLLSLLAALIILAVVIAIMIMTTMKEPCYSYRNFIWSPDGSRLCYLRAARQAFQDNALTGDQEIWVADAASSERKKAAAIKAAPAYLRVLGWYSMDNSLFLLNESPLQVYKVFPDTMKVIRYDLQLPGLTGVFYDREFIYTVQRMEEERKVLCGYLDCINLSFNEIITFKEKEGEHKDIVEAETSKDGRFCAIGYYYTQKDDDAGLCNILIYDTQKKASTKLLVDSYGDKIDFEWSPYEELLAMRVTEKNEYGEINHAVCFYEPQQEGRVDKLVTGDLKKTFNLFWNKKNNLFMIMEDSIYLMQTNASEATARSLLKWSATGYRPSEFRISPEGTRILFTTITEDKIYRNDSYMMNVDGTDIRPFIRPEGRRALERNPFFAILFQGRDFIDDFSYFIRTGHKKQ